MKKIILFALSTFCFSVGVTFAENFNTQAAKSSQTKKVIPKKTTATESKSNAANENNRGIFKSPENDEREFVIEGFYGAAQNDIFSDTDEKIDVFGLNGLLQVSSIKINKGVDLDIALIGGFHAGAKEEDTYEAGVYGNIEASVADFHFGVQPKLSVSLTPSIEVFGRGRLGASMTYFNFDLSASNAMGYVSVEEDDTTIGLYYGIGIGAGFKINDTVSIVLGIDYIGSTAKPEVDLGWGETLKIKSQDYITCSIGCAFRF